MGDTSGIPLPKVCSACGRTKKRYDFPVDKSSPDGRLSTCAACRAESGSNRRNYWKRRFKDAREEFEEALKEGRLVLDPDVVVRLRERLASEMRTCGVCGAEKPLTEYYIRIRNGRHIEVRPACRPCHNRRTVEGRKRVSPSAALCRYKQSAVKKGLSFDLDLPFVEAALASPCSYCGDDSILMTLDRVDSSLGYVRQNCTPSCLRCNLVKADMPVAAWRMLVPVMREARIQGAFGGWVGRNHFPARALSK